MTEPSHHDHGCEPTGGARAWLPGVIDVIALVLLAVFLLVTSWTGQVRLFVAPAYVWLPPSAGVLLLAMALARLSGLRRAAHLCCDDDCHSSVSNKKRLMYAAGLLIPVVLAMVINPRQFSAEGVRKRRAAMVARDHALDTAVAWILGRHEQAKLDTSQPALPEQPNVRDVLEAVERYASEQLDGRFVTLIGQCSPIGGDGRRFDLYRLVVTCCIADAQSVSIEVASKAPAQLDSGQWVRIGGVLRVDRERSPWPVLEAAKIDKIPLPTRPYL